MKIENIYIASNGDIFAKYDFESAYTEHSPEEVAHLYAEAARLLSEGKTTFCTAKMSSVVIKHLDYYAGDTFVATADIHIFAKWSNKSDFFYIRRMSEETEMKTAVDTMLTTVGAAIPLSEWAEAHDIDPATARQRATRGAFQTARKLGRNWIIDKDEPLIDHRRKY